MCKAVKHKTLCADRTRRTRHVVHLTLSGHPHRTWQGPRQSGDHCLQEDNVAETSERRGGERVGFFPAHTLS